MSHECPAPWPLCSRPLEFIQPLATRAEAWQAIPGVSEWVMGILKRGYSLQFAQRPLWAAWSPPLQSENAHVLSSDVLILLEKGAIEKSSFSSERLILLQQLLLHPQEEGRPPAHPRSQMPKLHPHEEVIQADHIETPHLANSASETNKMFYSQLPQRLARSGPSQRWRFYRTEPSSSAT